jgi:hypothetical protein
MNSPLRNASALELVPNSTNPIRVFGMVITVGCMVATHTFVVEYPYSSLTAITALAFSADLHGVP